MALAINSQESGGIAARIFSDTGPLSYSFTNAAGDFLLVGIVVTNNAGGTASIASATYGGDALTALGTGQLSNVNATLTKFYYKIAPKTGANTLVVNYNVSGSSNGACLAAAISFTGAHQTTPLSSEVKATGSGTTSATGSISNTSGNYLVALVSEGSGTAPSNGTGNTLSASLAGSPNNAGDNIGLEYFAATGTSRNMQFTFPSDTWGTVGVEVKAASGVTLVTKLNIGHLRPNAFAPGNSR